MGTIPFPVALYLPLPMYPNFTHLEEQLFLRPRVLVAWETCLVPPSHVPFAEKGDRAPALRKPRDLLPFLAELVLEYPVCPFS